jgi:hypothetical protein
MNGMASIKSPCKKEHSVKFRYCVRLSLLVAIFALSPSFLLFSQSAKALGIGSLLLIQSPDAYEVYSAGEYLGTTPLLISGLKPGKLEIELRLGETLIRQLFLVSAQTEGLKTWKPERPVPADAWEPPAFAAPAALPQDAGTALLDLKGLPKNASVFLDGTKLEFAPGAAQVECPAGAHAYRIDIPGRVPREGVILLESGAVAALSSSYSAPGSGAAKLPGMRSPEAKAKSRAAGFLTLAIGAGLSVASMVLNADGVSVPASGGDYALYQGIKYASLAGMGAGLAVSGIGLGFMAGK